MAKTNLSKLLPKFIKKGGQQVKDLTQKILDNAAASKKRKLENDKASKEDQQTKGAPADGTGVKRPREVDGGLQSGPKRMAVTGNSKDAGKIGPGSNKGAQMNKLPGAAALRPKPSIVAPKPSSLFGTLSSASKRPGTTNAERAAAAAAKPRCVLRVTIIPNHNTLTHLQCHQREGKELGAQAIFLIWRYYGGSEQAKGSSSSQAC